jgi:signal transduction histidine kinase
MMRSDATAVMPADVSAEPSEAERAALTAAYRADTARILLRRLDLIVTVFLVLVGLTALLNQSHHPEQAQTVAIMYLTDIIVCLVAVLVCRSSHLWPGTVGAALAIMLGALMSVHHGRLGGRIEYFAIAQICLLTSFAMLLPWGWRTQVVVAASTIFSVALATTPGVRDEDLTYALIALFTGAVTSVLGAYFLDRYRYDAFVRTSLLERTSALKQEEADISSALLHIGETINAHLDQPDLLERVSQIASETLGCDWSTIFVWEERRQAFRLSASIGLRAEAAAELAPLDLRRDALPLFGALRPATVVEITDRARQTLLPPELMQRWEASSALFVPICRRDDVIAILGIGYRARKGPFSAKQYRLATGIAHITAVAFENARLINDLQTASRLKSDFVATMSHELRTPLNVITGYTDLITDGAFGPLSDGQRDTLGRVRRSAIQLLDLVNATLDIGRLESGREPVAFDVVDLGELFAELDHELEGLVPETVMLIWRPTAEAHQLLSDRIKLKTILKNLVGNALKFTPMGTVEVKALASTDRVTLMVRDTGIGIAAEDLPVIFDMFRQVDGSSTRRFGGVGLGLHIVKRLVGLLNGTIEVESIPEVGSTFRVTLPVNIDAASRRAGVA